MKNKKTTKNLINQLPDHIAKQLRSEVKNEVEKITKYTYVKDSEGFVTKKLKNQVEAYEKIISKEEFEQASGMDYYKRPLEEVQNE